MKHRNTLFRLIHKCGRISQSSVSRKALAMICAIILATQSVDGKTTVHQIQFDITDYSFQTDLRGQLIINSSDPAIFYAETNAPALPLRSIDIAIGGEERYVSSEITFSRRIVKDQIVMAQNPIPVPTDGSVTALPKWDQPYDKKTYPDSNCQYLSSSSWPGVKVLHFAASPFVYNAENGKLYFTDSIQLTVTTESDADTQSAADMSSTYDILKNVVYNKSFFESGLPNHPNAVGKSDRLDYLIITSNSLKSAFEPLRYWKQTKGLYSEIATIEEIAPKYRGTDLQIKIKKYLQDEYLNRGLKYVLLGGDDTVVPVRGCYGYCSGEKDYTIPTDMYYACFSGNFDWDGNKNGIYGEVADGIDMAQHIYVTRVPVRTTSDTHAYISKLIEYERNPNWDDSMLLCGVRLNPNNKDVPNDAEFQAEYMYENYVSPYWNGTKYRFYDTATDFEGGESYNVTNSNLMDQISRGYGFIDVTTHGGNINWAMEDNISYLTSHASAQQNKNSSIITTASCLTNAFDSVSSNKIYEPCLSEAFIRNPHNGIVAYLGCSRYGWYKNGKQGDYIKGASLNYNCKFYENLFSDSMSPSKYGEIVAAAKMSFITESLTYGSFRWIQFGLNPIGDPEMPLYRFCPNKFNTINISYQTNHITIETDEPGCRICIVNLNNLIHSIYRIYDNVERIDVDDMPSHCQISITKPGYVPEIFTVRLLQNTTLSKDLNFYDNIIFIGKDLTTVQDTGEVIFKDGNVEMRANSTIFKAGAIVKKGATVTVRGNIN